MSEEPVRRGWRGEAAGIPPARVLVPAAVALSTSVSASASASASAGFSDAEFSTAGPRSAPDTPGESGSWDFPLWPTTRTVALHEAPPGGADEMAAAYAEEMTAHGAGRAAYADGAAAHKARRAAYADDVTAHKAGRAGYADEAMMARQAGGAAYADDVTAHEAGRAAVVDHLAGRAEQWPPPGMRAMRQARDTRRTAPERRARRHRVRPVRGPAAGLSAMLLMAMLAGFFAWTSAEPFWLDMGHRVHGTAEITSCKGAGVLRRCLAEFSRLGGGEPVPGTRLVGLDGPPHSSVAAEMVPGGRIAYAGNPAGLRVRWAAGLGLIVLCGIVLAWLTGAWRFNRLRDRLTAWTLTAAAPLVLSAAIVLAAY